MSAHGRWWEVQTVALESAYGGTPYFEYLFDSFRPLFGPRPVEGETIADLIRRANNVVRRIMGIRTYFLKTFPLTYLSTTTARHPSPTAHPIASCARTASASSPLQFSTRLFN